MQVPFEGLSQAKGPATLCAHKGCFSRVQVLVFGQLTSSAELLVAHLTAKPLNAQVASKVALEVRRSEERFPTLVTRITFHLIMYAHMLIEGANQRKGSTTLVTDKGSLTTVFAKVVSNQSRCLAEVFTALGTQIGFLPRVDPHVDLEVPLAGDPHPTLWAGDTLTGVEGPAPARPVCEELKWIARVFFVVLHAGYQDSLLT